MKKYLLVPEDVYAGLLNSNSVCQTSTDPYDKAIQDQQKEINSVLHTDQKPADVKAALYNQALKRLKQYKALKPEAAIERQDDLPDAVLEDGTPVFESARHSSFTTSSPAKPTDSVRVASPELDITQESPKKAKKKKKSSFKSDATQHSVKKRKKQVSVDEKTDATQPPSPPPPPIVKKKKEKPVLNSNNLDAIDSSTLPTALKSTPLERRVGRITQALYDHPDELPINNKGNILLNGKIMYGSRISQSIKYALEGQQGRAPNGFKFLWQEIEKQPALKSLFIGPVQRGDGQFKFRPTLWRTEF